MGTYTLRAPTGAHSNETAWKKGRTESTGQGSSSYTCRPGTNDWTRCKDQAFVEVYLDHSILQLVVANFGRACLSQHMDCHSLYWL